MADIEKILEECQIHFTKMMVESSNFRVIMRKLHELNKSNLTVCLLRVTGKVRLFLSHFDFLLYYFLLMIL